ncbi:MAG: NAD(P)H-dependent oxidoreductase [Hahellaceae bacterium]|nr:NAD(P)H-dependent oxidoreductase [Hahellaceae bacterium]
MSHKALVVTASVQHEGSVSRGLVSELVKHLKETGVIGEVTERDLSDNATHLLTQNDVGAFYTAPDQRTAAQQAQIEQSDTYLRELREADILVIGTPMYNFSVPAVLKAWIDQICRVGETFRYTEQGVQGLLSGKKAYLVIATGGVPVNSGVDFLVPYLKHILGFIGITDVQVVAADRTNAQRAVALEQARGQIAALA